MDANVRLDSPSVYTVEKVLNERVNKGKKEFLVKWLNYGPEHQSWEPESNIYDHSIISEFYRRKAERKRKGGEREEHIFKI